MKKDVYTCPHCGKEMKYVGMLDQNDITMLSSFTTSISNTEPILNYKIDLSLYENKNICDVFLNALEEKAKNEFLKFAFFEYVKNKYNINYDIDKLQIYDATIFYHE